jgi:hypothetical protein
LETTEACGAAAAEMGNDTRITVAARAGNNRIRAILELLKDNSAGQLD